MCPVCRVIAEVQGWQLRYMVCGSLKENLHIKTLKVIYLIHFVKKKKSLLPTGLLPRNQIKSHTLTFNI